MNRLALTVFIWLFSLYSFAQCPTILSSNTNFTKDGVCAPVNVTAYTATYTFLSAQTPTDVEIHFEWNDPANTIDMFVDGGGLVVMGGNTIFEATGSFSYNPGTACSYVPTVSLVFQGGVCETSSQTVVVWDDDDNFGGVMALNPNAYGVCENTAITNAVFADVSTYNCNANDNDPTIANREARYTQYVYGTNHPANSIRDLTIDDGGPQVITDGTGALNTPAIRGGVTAGYFGAIVQEPTLADQTTINVNSLPISAPANVLNTVGSTFEVTLYNWNTCNPWNMDVANPNYGAAAP